MGTKDPAVDELHQLQIQQHKLQQLFEKPKSMRQCWVLFSVSMLVQSTKWAKIIHVVSSQANDAGYHFPLSPVKYKNQ